jgi:hypothetical protein
MRGAGEVAHINKRLEPAGLVAAVMEQTAMLQALLAQLIQAVVAVLVVV